MQSIIFVSPKTLRRFLNFAIYKYLTISVFYYIKIQIEGIFNLNEKQYLFKTKFFLELISYNYNASFNIYKNIVASSILIY